MRLFMVLVLFLFSFGHPAQKTPDDECVRLMPHCPHHMVGKSRGDGGPLPMCPPINSCGLSGCGIGCCMRGGL